MEINAQFISVEGIDGVGKTTFIDELARSLPRVVRIRQPDGIFREALLSRRLDPMEEAVLCAASLRHAVDVLVKSALENGFTVVADRFHDSLLAYQGFGRGCSIDWLRTLLPDILPDKTILLDCDPEIALARCKGGDRIEREGLDFHRRVRNGFLCLAQDEPERFYVMEV